ncbi:MAG: hypothetical protein JOY54_01755 [Acidobacteriaceae bacterium]|nr:hypothetical protein [Acidobacteriaceae bacterium]
MAAIAPSRASRALLAVLLLPAFAYPQAPGNDTNQQSAAARAVLGYVAAALTAGNAADAMTPFEKSFPNYDTLNSYFNGLVNAFYVSNEIEVLDEDNGTNEMKLSVRWAITLTDLQTDYTEHRSAELNLHMVCKGGKWKIADLAPISLFDPAARQTRQDNSPHS